MKRTEGERHAPQGRARTMSDEQERLVRERVGSGGNYTMETVGVSVSLSDVLRELDAERAAHAETKAKLALAEAVCGPANEVMDKLLAHGPSIVPHLVDTDDNAGQRLREALAAWNRRAK